VCVCGFVECKCEHFVYVSRMPEGGVWVCVCVCCARH
jgi:hypothetical protein